MTVRRTPKQTSAYKSQEVREYERIARLASIARKRRAFTRLKRNYEFKDDFARHRVEQGLES